MKGTGLDLGSDPASTVDCAHSLTSARLLLPLTHRVLQSKFLEMSQVDYSSKLQPAILAVTPSSSHSLTAAP